MTGNGKHEAACGVAIQGRTPWMLHVALAALRRQGLELQSLPACSGEACSWARDVAECLQRGDCQGAVLFCDDAGACCCVTNKVAGVRAASVWSVAQAERAVLGFGANLLVVETAGRTYFEFKEILRLGASPRECPDGVACVLADLEHARPGNGAAHAHR